MCHGVSWQPRPRKIRHTLNRLTAERFETYFQIASELGFQSISYEHLANWMKGTATVPERPIMFDFDHPDWSIGQVIWPIMQQFGYTGNLFINTSPMEKVDNPYYMKWDEVRALMEAGWHIGAHTHRHYNLDYLAKKDPSGRLIREELETCDELIYTHLGIVPRDFAYTGPHGAILRRIKSESVIDLVVFGSSAHTTTRMKGRCDTQIWSACPALMKSMAVRRMPLDISRRTQTLFACPR